MDTPDDLDPQTLLERAQHTLDETQRRHAERPERVEQERTAPAAPMAEMDAIREQNQETLRRLDALAADPSPLETTVTRVRRMAERQTHPTWMHAAYADLAGRLARVEDRLEELGDSLSLLHSKMEMLSMQRAMEDREARDD